MRLSTWQIIQFNILSYVLSQRGREGGVFRLLACFPAWWWVGSVVSRGVGEWGEWSGAGHCQQQQQEWQQSALKHNEITLDILSIKYG